MTKYETDSSGSEDESDSESGEDDLGWVDMLIRHMIMIFMNK